MPPETPNARTPLVFLGYTLIAQKKEGVLSDKIISRVLTSCQIVAIMTLGGKKIRRSTKMYIKDKSNRITLRLNDEQFYFVKQNSDFLGVSPSEFLRMVVNASMATTKTMFTKVEEGLGRANDKTDIDNIV